MVTPDKDYGQLVEENIYMYKPSRMGNGIDILGVEEIKAKWGIERPEQVIDMLGLIGDKVDNIPGVPGIGPKTAEKFIKQFDSMEVLLDSTDQIKGKNQERLREFREQALQSKELATIIIDVPGVTFHEEAYRIENFDREHLTDIFRELEFRSIAKDILGSTEEPENQIGAQGNLFAPSTSPAPAAAPKKGSRYARPPAHALADHHIGNTEQDYKKVDTPEERAALIAELKQQKLYAFDTETTSVDATSAQLVGLSFSWEAATGYYVPVPADRKEAEAIVAEFAELLADETTQKVGQNIKYDLTMLERYGAPVGGKLLDTMVMHYLLHPDKRHKMDLLSEEYLNYKPVAIETLIGKGKKQLTMRTTPSGPNSKRKASWSSTKPSKRH